MIKLNKNSDHKILCVDISKIPFVKPFLEALTEEKGNAGKKSENHFIINTEVRINPDGSDEIEVFNAFINQCQARNYNSLMVLT